MIGPECLVGTGRFARILVEPAKEQLARRRHIGQALRNGIGTRVPISMQILVERLEQERRRNRREAEREEQLLRGLVTAADAQAALAHTQRRIEETFLGMTAPIADRIAQKYGLPVDQVQQIVERIISARSHRGQSPSAPPPATGNSGAAPSPATAARKTGSTGNIAGAGRREAVRQTPDPR